MGHLCTVVERKALFFRFYTCKDELLFCFVSGLIGLGWLCGLDGCVGLKEGDCLFDSA